MVNSKNKAVVGVLMMVVLFFAILMLFAFYTLNIFSSSQLGPMERGDGPIAVVEINGVIMDAKKTIELLNMAEEDEGVKAIILRVDSPGGAVGPTQEIYEEIMRIDQKIPVYASFGAVAASGGYYVGAAARKIFASPGTLTGSIGVIMQFLDLSKLYDVAKVTQLNLKSGRYKDIGQPNRPMTEEEKQLLEGLIKGVHQQFIDDILRRRKDKIQGDILQLAQGQIFSGQKARELGLVDEMGGLWAAGRKMHEDLGLKGKFGLKFIKKKKRTNFLELMEGLDEAGAKILSVLQSGDTPRIMYGQ